MLIEFRVSNYRSIKGEQLLSLVAAKDKSHAETHVIEDSTPPLVRSAVIYGANASGKSNLIKALIYMQAVVAESATHMQASQPFNVQSFKLDKKTVNEPSEFEVTFSSEGIRYQYGFKLTPERIQEEWLLVYKKTKPQKWFTRCYNSDSNVDDYELGSHLGGQRKLWQESTRSNALFLSTAVNLNSEQLRPVFNWIVNNLICFPSGESPNPEFSTDMIQKNKERKLEISSFLSSADISITNIDIAKRKRPTPTFKFDVSTGKATFIQNVETDIISPQFHHTTDHGAATFEFQDESMGTQRLFCLAGPIFEILSKGQVLIVDELDGSLHPLLIKRLVSMFHNTKTNPKGAQLVFTTHNTALLDKDIFRRDQVWFIEKNRDQASILYPLTNFSPRKNEALESGYLMGRYGAIPFFTDFDQ